MYEKKSDDLGLSQTECQYTQEVYYLIAGDLDPDAQSRIHGHIKGCSVCQEHFRELSQAGDLLDRRLSKERCWQGVQANDKKPAAGIPMGQVWKYGLLFSAASAACVLIVFGIMRLGQDPGQGLRIKGGLDALLVKLNPDGSQVKDPIDFRPGDRLQVILWTAKPGKATLLIVNQTMQVSLLVPPGSQTVWVPADQRMVFPKSLRLDDSLDPERLILVVGRPEDRLADTLRERVQKALAAENAPPDLGRGWDDFSVENVQMASWLIQKTQHPGR